MSFTRDEIREAMLLYAVTDRSWLRPGQTLPQVAERVLDHGATFLPVSYTHLTLPTKLEV